MECIQIVWFSRGNVVAHVSLVLLGPTIPRKSGVRKGVLRRYHKLRMRGALLRRRRSSCDE